MINSTFLQTKNNNMNNSTKTTTTFCVLSSQLQQSQSGLLAIETKTASSPGRTRKKTSVLLSALLIAMFSVFCTNVSSQTISSYTFSSTAGTYTAVAGTTISTETWDDQSTTTVLPIGFSFNFGGTIFTDFGVNANGWIRLGANPVSSYTPISSQITNDIIAPFARDLQGQTGSSIQYTTTGSAPNRILTVQWTNYRRYGGSGQSYNFQIKLYETSDVVEFVYGTITPNSTSTFNTNQVGIRNAGGFSNRSTGSNWSASIAGAFANTSCYANNAVKPISGLTYAWTPPPANPATPVQLGGTPTCTLGAQLGFTTTSVSCSASATASGTDNTGVTATVTDFSCPTSEILSATLNASIGTGCAISYYSYSIIVNGATVAANQCNITGFDLTPFLPLTSVSIVSQDDDAFGDAVTMNLTVNLNYEEPFSFPADVVYYWQSIPTGTSQTTPHVDPFFVASNGTYYVRAFNTVSGLWSAGSSSVTVTNFPLAPAPPAPVAALNPSCAPDGTTISVDAAPDGTTYYWQGTTVDGTSIATEASTPFEVTSSGTYQVSAFETISGCWSASSSVAVTVDTYIPGAPSAAVDNFNICSGATTLEVSASTPVAASPTTVASGALSLPIPDSNPTGVSSILNVNNIPAGATITGISVNMSATHTWNSDLDIYLTGANGTQIELSTDNGGSGDNYTNTTFSSAGVTAITAGASPFTGTFLPEGNFTSLYSVGNGDWTIKLADDQGGDLGVLLDWSISISYTVPASTISWYDAATAGNGVGTGTPLETVGTSVLSNPALLGTYQFYAGAVSGACASSTRTLVTVNVTDVNATLIPVDATCNGGENGFFILGTDQCGTEPFLYSVDGGAFGLPTYLAAGTYSVVIEDAGGLFSSPITVVVGQPAPPADLTASNILYFSADISWTTTGDETSWTVEYGPVGFTPGTGTSLVVSTATDTTLTGLTQNTSYDYYVTANCGAGSVAGGPGNFNTNAGFLTYDNACPASGFVDISGTGTNLNLFDDGVSGITLPFSFSYQNQTINTMTVGNNGGVLLNSLTGNVGFGGDMTTLPSNYLFLWGDDLDEETGSVYWEVTGTAPNQTLIVQWDNSNNYFNGPGTVTFQLQIEEATGIIYFVYDDVEFGGGETADDYAGNADIGISGPTTDINVSNNDQTYLQNYTCVRFYNALCPNPVNPVVTAFQEEVIIEWTAGLYGETEWAVIYGPAGFDPATEGTTLTASSPIVNIFGLTQLTDYDVYIYSECMLDDLTSLGLLVEFQTLPWCANPTGLDGTVAVDSLFASWNWTEVPGATNGGISGFNIQCFSYESYLGLETLEAATGNDFADTVANPSFLGGGVYQYYVQAVCGTDTSNYSGPFSFIMPLSNDSICGAEMLSVDGTVYYFNNTGATIQTEESGIIPTGGAPDGYNTTDLPVLTWGIPFADGTTWFTFEAPASGSMRFSGLDENWFASQIAIYETTDCGDLAEFNLVAASDQVSAVGQLKVAPNFTICGLTPGATYYVMHDATSNSPFGGLPLFGQYSIKMTPIVLEAGSLADVINTCTGSTVNLFDGIAGYDNGGVWTAELPSAGTQLVGSEWNSAGFAYQIFNFEYRMADGCAFDTTFANVRVWAPSNAGTDGSVTVCRNEPFDLLSGLNGTVDLGGVWLDPSLQTISESAIISSNTSGQFNYYYVASNGICPSDTALVLVNVGTCDYLDVEEMFFGTMTIMPNPSNGVFNINNIGSTEVFNYEVTDLGGRVIFTKDAAINGTETTVVDLTDKVPGMYMIRVYNDNAEKIFRVIKQ